MANRSLLLYRSLGIAAALFVCSTSAHAEQLGLEKTNPDIFASSLDVEYNATTDTLTVNRGATSNYTDSFGTTYSVFGTRPYTLTATIDEFGNATAGTLTIRGGIVALGYASNTLLLSGELCTADPNYVADGNFGFDDTYSGPGSAPPGYYDIFEFIFKVTGGALAADFGGVGTPIGIILDANFANPAPFDGTWDSSFNNFPGGSNTGTAVTDNFELPTPAALPMGLLLLGVLGLRYWRRR